MKRPQFGIRLLLLIVALAATVLAWRQSVAVSDRTEREGSISLLQWKIAGLERERDSIEYARHFGHLNQSFIIDDEPINAAVAAARKQLKQLQP
jgi:hypothetical protein